MYRHTVWSQIGELLETAEQETPPDVEALVAKHNLGYWRRVWYVKRLNTTFYTCVGGRINVKKIKGNS